jgi:hypothetical protein
VTLSLKQISASNYSTPLGAKPLQLPAERRRASFGLLRGNYPPYCGEKGQIHILGCQQYSQTAWTPRRRLPLATDAIFIRERMRHIRPLGRLPVPVKAAFRGGAFRTGPCRGGIRRRGPCTSARGATRELPAAAMPKRRSSSRFSGATRPGQLAAAGATQAVQIRVFPGTEKIDENLHDLAHAAVLSAESAAGEAETSSVARLVVVIR